jgi:DNA-binding MarR family transcriptional regulator
MQLDSTMGPTREVAIPDDFDSPQAKLLYLYLLVSPNSSADEICSALDVDKGSVLSVVRTLRKHGHVERADGRYRPA